jgi:N6-adenosine-specific RNA methylase IME4
MSNIFDNIITDRPMTYDLFGKMIRKWRVFYVDPPWKFNHRSELGEGRNPNRHYDTMSLEDMIVLPVGDLAEDNAVMAMWATDTTMAQAINLMHAWGFRYNTVLFYWLKTRLTTDLEAMHFEKDLPMGTGYISRANPEVILLGTRGEPSLRTHIINGVRRTRGDIRKVQFAPRGVHSAKPKMFMDLIEQLYDGPYLELFARNQREGWGSWGNQILTGPSTEKKQIIIPQSEMPLFS